MDWKNQKEFFVLKILGIESGTTSSLNLEKDTCHWQSMCYKIHLRFNISQKEIFLKSASVIVMEKYDESALIQLFLRFGTF